MIPLKSENEMKMLASSGKILAKVLKKLEALIRPGVTTSDIDRAAEELITKEDAKPAFKGYRGYQ